MAKKSKPKATIEIINRKAKFEYHFLAQFEMGIILTGTEIKSVRLGEVNLKDAYCLFTKEGELIIKSMFIAEYKFGNQNNHETRRDRKLLLRKPELRKLQKKVKEKGFSIVPYRMYIGDRGKMEIVLGQGKKSYDKRDTIKQRDNKRELDRVKKMYR
jgi:SsrA-binding protein